MFVSPHACRRIATAIFVGCSPARVADLPATMIAAPGTANRRLCRPRLARSPALQACLRGVTGGDRHRPPPPTPPSTPPCCRRRPSVASAADATPPTLPSPPSPPARRSTTTTPPWAMPTAPGSLTETADAPPSPPAPPPPPPQPARSTPPAWGLLPTPSRQPPPSLWRRDRDRHALSILRPQRVLPRGPRARSGHPERLRSRVLFACTGRSGGRRDRWAHLDASDAR